MATPRLLMNSGTASTPSTSLGCRASQAYSADTPPGYPRARAKASSRGLVLIIPVDDLVESLLRQDRLKFGQPVADHGPGRFRPGAADLACEREWCLVAGPDGRSPLVPAGKPGADAVEFGRGEPGDRASPNLAPIAGQHAGPAQELVLGERVADPVRSRREFLA